MRVAPRPRTPARLHRGASAGWRTGKGHSETRLYFVRGACAPVNFYKRHLGDYAKDTAHLSQGQIGAYDLLMDWYYANERPIPLDKADAMRIARAHTAQEKRDTAKVLEEFFEKSDDGYRHKRIERELQFASVKSAKASKSASVRWQGADASSMRTHSDGNATRACAETPDFQDSISQTSSEASVEGLAREPAPKVQSGLSKEIDLAARAAWEQLEPQLSRIGARGTPEFQDPLTRDVVTAMGGWVALCRSLTHDVPRRRVEFKQRYTELATRAAA